jgi:glutathione S-transferase
MSGFISIEEARTRKGLRLVLTAGVPGPWGEAAKGVFHAKGIAYARVPQVGAQDNAGLVAWTGFDNAPQAVLDDEPARTGWAEILFLAEAMQPKPALIPSDPRDRASMFGLAHELLGQHGLCWSRRLMMLHPLMQLPEDNPVRSIGARLAGKYGYTPAQAEAAPARVADIVRMFSQQLDRQRELGRPGFVGEAISAVDIYWAAAAGILSPLPEDVCPMNPMMRSQYAFRHPLIDEALDPELLAHRDDVYARFMEYPPVLE